MILDLTNDDADEIVLNYGQNGHVINLENERDSSSDDHLDPFGFYGYGRLRRAAYDQFDFFSGKCRVSPFTVLKSYKKKLNELEENLDAKEDVKKQYHRMTCEDLKNELIAMGLPKSGNKPDLLQRIQDHMGKTEKTEDDSLDKLILAHGTKIAHLVFFLKALLRNPAQKVILFSQYEEFLRDVGEVLNTKHIPNRFLQGNVFTKTNCITSFKEKESVRVLMLSLKNAASGTNLIEATHIIFLDAVSGTKLEAQAIEAQAIGRALRQGQTNMINVVRFVIRDSLEFDFYVRNTEDSQREVELIDVVDKDYNELLDNLYAKKAKDQIEEANVTAVEEENGDNEDGANEDGESDEEEDDEM
jgi:SNF2 family DNA or RNA helicase